MDASQFRVVSIGIVAENKQLSEKTIEAVPIEFVSFIDGEIKYDPQLTTVEGVDALGKQYNVQFATDNTLTAHWLALGNTNRRTAPDVRRGERVLLWQAADADKFYWTSMGMDDHLRKLETVIYTFSATKDESIDSTDPANCYFVEVSTHNKTITLHTSDKNGEPYKYTFQFNTKDGVVTLTDDVGNYVEFDSSQTKITLKNRDGSYLTLDKKDIIAFAPKNLEMEAGSMIKFKCGNSEFTLLPTKTTLKTPKFEGQQ